MMTAAGSVADVLNDHVVVEVECIDRMYLNVELESPTTPLSSMNSHAAEIDASPERCG
jgi:hypothetical protein